MEKLAVIIDAIFGGIFGCVIVLIFNYGGKYVIKYLHIKKQEKNISQEESLMDVTKSLQKICTHPINEQIEIKDRDGEYGSCRFPIQIGENLYMNYGAYYRCSVCGYERDIKGEDYKKLMLENTNEKIERLKKELDYEKTFLSALKNNIKKGD